MREPKGPETGGMGGSTSTNFGGFFTKPKQLKGGEQKATMVENQRNEPKNRERGSGTKGENWWGFMSVWVSCVWEGEKKGYRNAEWGKVGTKAKKGADARKKHQNKIRKEKGQCQMRGSPLKKNMGKGTWDKLLTARGTARKKRIEEGEKNASVEG